METQKHKRYKCPGFTLVELMVIITILTILGTIGFVQMQRYAGSARDSVRTSDIANIMKALEIHQNKTGSYPTPTGSILSYTGGISGGNIIQQGTLNGLLIKFSVAAPIDPMAKVGYNYSILGNGLYYQIVGEMESPFWI